MSRHSVIRFRSPFYGVFNILIFEEISVAGIWPMFNRVLRCIGASVIVLA
jgi:hypothetical protein